MTAFSPQPGNTASPLQFAVDQLVGGWDLGEQTVEAAVAQMVGGTAPAHLIAEFLLALRARSESAAAVAGGVRALRGAMRRVPYAHPDRLVDTCGTGGGAFTTVNLSTAAAFVAAGAGIVVAKHGNRSYTSRSGSADVLEALGVPIDIDEAGAARLLDEVGIVFLFAPVYHPAMRHVTPVRRELKVPTLMNMIGPLANPAGAGRQVVGIGSGTRAPAMAGALARLGSIHSLVVHAAIGMDEFSPVGTTAVWEVRGGDVREWQFDPAATRLATASLDGLEGSEPEANAAKIVRLLEAPGDAAPALRSAVLLNAAAAIYVGGLAQTLEDAIDIAVQSLESGKAREKLNLLRAASDHDPAS